MISLIIGSSSSGKSLIAESIATSFNENMLYYLATMRNSDSETNTKVEKHRLMREGKGFNTVEKCISVCDIDINSGSVLLLECMSNLLANEMYLKEGSGECAHTKIVEDIKKLSLKCKHLVVVTNDVFSDIPNYNEFCTDYINKLGFINNKLAKIADEVIEVVVGIPIYHKKNEKEQET